MNETTTPNPVTITIGGKSYTGAHPAPAVWRAFLDNAAPDATLAEQLKATATLLHEIIGTDAKNEVASRLAAGEIRGADVLEAVYDAANQWRAQAQSFRVEPLTADERDVLKHAAAARGRAWTSNVLDALNPWPWESVEDASELISQRWGARNSRLVAALFGLERRGYLTPPAILADANGPAEYRDITAAGRAALDGDHRP